MAPSTKKSGKTYSTVRFGWICAGMLVCFFLLAFRVGYLQLLEHQQLANQADQRSIRTQVVPTNRAMITDRNNEALAVSVSSKDIVLDPKHILDTQTDTGNERWQSMANVLKIPLADVQHLIQSNAHKRFVYLARKVEDDNAAYISKLHLTGVSTEQDFSRFYPMGQDAAGLIGIVGQDNQGLEGIELGFNPLLQGKNGLRVYQKDGSGAVIGVIKSVDPVPPPNVTLSIDKFIQYVLYAQIRDGVVANQADSGCAVLVKIDTGEILGMASYPSFNPNNYGSTPAKDIRNVCSSDSFEPGSTVKPVVVMVGLEHKLIRPDTVLDTTPYRVNGHLIKDVGHWSKLTITGVLQKSSDIAVSHIALALPATVLPAVYRSFGLGRPTELGIGNESSGYLPQHRERWADIERATFSFGYGLRVTPLQMAREYAAIGSFGIYRPLSITKVTPPVMGQRILPADTVRSVVHMMESDALPGGSGVSAAVPGYRLAIKTGTAEKMGPSGKYDGGYINYTAGVAPASDPQVALVVMVNNPKAGKHFGGSVAGPVFGKIMAQVLEHMNILPDAQPLNVVSSVKG
ncbi:peptidoglycan synthase [Serratia sp. OLHL2]|uniref:Peptidoglycan D,D-transpeptidase FtsI n=3 Tax=Bacteria TaxID=2 RepID=A0A9X9C204_9GAMM|nr:MULTISPECIES: penicillin-binding transpeptidase domain-containing protein [Serratia]AHN97649.1 cell division protein FtsI [uncultured bacterium Lac_20]KAB5496742.1 peptidoglycan synthase [Enterobacter sp. RJAL6]MBZ0045688.1 peptidoglycan synthase [Serratia sp. EWG9]ALD46929.1 peptidoglycan synthase [Serratia marcescens]ASL92761.1 peptidoglycan synthase [Serratia marcescens]